MLGRGENSIFKTFNELTHINPNISIKEVIGDVINKKKLQGVFRSFMPQIVFHAGADKHVPLMELNPDEAVLNNVMGTKNILEVASEYNAEKVVCISTDKAVNPTSVMGCCKRICELLVQSNAKGIVKPVAVRFGNVLGSRGSVIKLFQQQIAWGGPIAVTHPETTRFFMSIPEAAQLVIESGAMGQGGEIFVLNMGEQIKIVDLAKDLIQLAGYAPDVDIPLKFIGLRPGEKLKEELAAKDELLEETPNEKIWSIRPNGKVPANLNHEIDGLVESSLKMDFPSIVERLKVVVPEYKPQRTIKQ
jgi:FlaA1/EpsC-like NDP-sugar epimerase